MSDIHITFEIKSTDDINISNFNTLVLQMHNFKRMIEQGISTVREIKGYNLQIDHIIKTLDNMKFTIINSSTDDHIPIID